MGYLRLSAAVPSSTFTVSPIPSFPSFFCCCLLDSSSFFMRQQILINENTPLQFTPSFKYTISWWVLQWAPMWLWIVSSKRLRVQSTTGREKAVRCVRSLLIATHPPHLMTKFLVDDDWMFWGVALWWSHCLLEMRSAVHLWLATRSSSLLSITRPTLGNCWDIHELFDDPPSPPSLLLLLHRRCCCCK